ncbi:MAG TPA: twin-arginine translocase TatA/TatE family subunit [Blastocatellia bacterium]|nr:twin-arginine translocase TatA/TatE family subunit [Blastocatellia bacterium]
MGSLGWTEILIILVIALIIFGPRKLPELGKSLGQSLAQFRKASEDFKRTWEQEVEVEKQRLERLPSPSTYFESDDATASTASAYKESKSDETEEIASAPPAEETSTTIPRGASVTAETKRDWM